MPLYEEAPPPKPAKPGLTQYQNEEIRLDLYPSLMKLQATLVLKTKKNSPQTIAMGLLLDSGRYRDRPYLAFQATWDKKPIQVSYHQQASKKDAGPYERTVKSAWLQWKVTLQPNQAHTLQLQYSQHSIPERGQKTVFLAWHPFDKTATNLSTQVRLYLHGLSSKFLRIHGPVAPTTQTKDGLFWKFKSKFADDTYGFTGKRIEIQAEITSKDIQPQRVFSPPYQEKALSLFERWLARLYRYEQLGQFYKIEGGHKLSQSHRNLYIEPIPLHEWRRLFFHLREAAQQSKDPEVRRLAQRLRRDSLEWQSALHNKDLKQYPKPIQSSPSWIGQSSTCWFVQADAAPQDTKEPRNFSRDISPRNYYVEKSLPHLERSTPYQTNLKEAITTEFVVRFSNAANILCRVDQQRGSFLLWSLMAALSLLIFFVAWRLFRSKSSQGEPA
ncbi:MAG: hypothetical protein H6728_17185 [Myxococcales bacterium]|nr:hypothetical protein [Myxococcales bacterium]